MKFIKHFFISILAFVYLALEYIFWNSILEPSYRKLKSLKLYQRTLIFIKHQHKFVVLFVFILFFISSEILGIVALAFLADGLFVLFVFMYIIKFLPVAIAFTVLDNSKEELLTIKWFAVIYHFVAKVIVIIERNKLFIKTKQIFEIIKNKIIALVENFTLIGK